jgi:hypothetical protein
MSSTQRAGTGRSAEFADGGGGGGSGGAILVKQEAENVTGVTTNNATTTYALIPGTLVNITLDSAQVVFFEGLATLQNVSTRATNGQLGVRIDGVDYDGTTAYGVNATGPQHDSIVVHKAVELLAGAHTAQLIIRIRYAGAPSEAIAVNSADGPSRLTAFYAPPVSVAAGITKVEATSAGGGSFSTGSLTFVVVTGTTIAFSLTQAQTVLFSGFGSAIYDGAFRSGTVLGVRIDGVDYPGSWDYSAGLGQAVTSGLSAIKAIDLAAGAHTASLVVRCLGATTAGVQTNTDTPAYLCAIYNGSVLSAEAGIVAAAVFSGGNYAVTGAMSDVTDGAGFVEVTYVVPTTGNYFFEVDGAVAFGGTFPSDGGCNVGCSVNGVDQGYLFETPYIYTVSSTSNARAPFRYRMPLTLTAGVRTIRLRADLTGGIPYATIIKGAASPIVVALMKRP